MNRLMSFTIGAVKKSLSRCGLDVRRATNNPEHTLLGLKAIPIKSILDVGANSGQFAKSMSHHFPEATIVSFEPLPDAFRSLLLWTKTRHGRAHAVNVAIGDSLGMVTMYRHDDHDTSSSLLHSTSHLSDVYEFTRKQTAIDVEIKRLDDAVEDLRFKIEDEVLVKIDVQGYEEHVIIGAKDTLRRSCACILEVNVDELYQGQAGFLRLTELLYDSGLTYVGNLSQTCAADGHVMYLDAVFARRQVKF